MTGSDVSDRYVINNAKARILEICAPDDVHKHGLVELFAFPPFAVATVQQQVSERYHANNSATFSAIRPCNSTASPFSRSSSSCNASSFSLKSSVSASPSVTPT